MNPEPSAPAQREEDRPLGEIVNDVWLKAEALMRQEVQLGLAEMDERVERFKGEASRWLAALEVELLGKAVGVAVLLAGMLALTAAAILALGIVMSPWLAALLVGGALVGAGSLLLKRSMHVPNAPSARELIPQRALDSIDEDIKAIKGATK